jgi:hypothetical protein
VQSPLLQLYNESFVNMASVGTSVLMSCALSKPCRPSCEFSLSLPSRPLNPPFVTDIILRKKSEELGQKLDELTDKMEERIAVQSQALDNTVPQTQTANTIQTVATLEKKIQANNFVLIDLLIW